MGSAIEAEIGTCYINARDLIPICVCAEEMGHPQVPTPLQVDNTTALGFANKDIKQKMSKAIGMRLYLIQYKKGSRTIHYLLDPGKKQPCWLSQQRSSSFSSHSNATNNIALSALR